LKLIAIVALPHDVPLFTAGDHTRKSPQGKIATKPVSRQTRVARRAI
jgi:hypothetical protein